MELKPQPVQEKFLASPADIAIFGGSAGSGKAAHIDTLIPTPKGFLRMGQLEKGHQVFAVDGTISTVLRAFPIELREDAYEVEFDSGEKFIVDGDHLWKTMTRNEIKMLDHYNKENGHSLFPKDWYNFSYKGIGCNKYTFDERSEIARLKNLGFTCPQIGKVLGRTADAIQQQWNKDAVAKSEKKAITTSEIKDTLFSKRNSKNHCIPLCEPVALPEIDLPLNPWLLGYLLGDGDTSGSGRVSCDSKDLDFLCNKIEELGFKVSRRSDSIHFYICGLTNIWKGLSLDRGKYIPSVFMRSSIEQRTELVRGLIDSDGTVDSHGVYRFSNTNRELVDGFCELVASLGLKPKIYTRNRSRLGVECKESYDVAVPSSIVLSSLERKELKARHIWKREQGCRYIVSIRPVEPCFMRCIEIDHPSHLYLIGRTFVPTHNSYALLMEPLRHINNPNFGGVIFRREAKQINNEGGLRDTALTIYPGFGGRFRSQPTPMFNFPSGARITFEHLNQESDVSKWQGSQVPFIAYDELCHFSEAQFWYMLSRNRSTCGVRPYVRGTCNPDPDSWVAKFIEWWIDSETGYPIDSRSGKLRYFLRQPSPTGAVLVWASSPHAVLAELNMERPPEFELKSALQEIDDANAQGEDIPDEVSDIILYAKTLRSVRSATFVPAKIYDNPALLSKDPGYLANLKAQSRVERGRLLDGNWKIRAGGGLYFPSLDAKFVETLPTTITRWIRSWDLAATEPTEEHDPDWTVGMKLGRRPDGMIVIVDVIRIRRNARFVREIVRATAEADGKQTYIRIPQDPGQAGREQADSYRDMLRGFNLFTRVVTKNKTIMAEPVAAEWQRGRVALLRAPWNKEVLAELEQFPDAKHDDVVDALSGGYSLLLPNETPDYSAGGLSRRYR